MSKDGLTRERSEVARMREDAARCTEMAAAQSNADMAIRLQRTSELLNRRAGETEYRLNGGTIGSAFQREIE
jgi:hypothetical protein